MQLTGGKTVDVKLFADHRQIHVCAPDYTGDLADAWTAMATDDRIAAAGDIVGIGTEAADDVHVTVELCTREPALDKKGEHITEASVVSRGTLSVLGCTDYVPDAKKLTAKAGTWRLRSTHKNVAKREKIHIQLWPGKTQKPRVRVRYLPPAPKAPLPISAPRNRKQAVAVALRGNIDAALAKLLALHAYGDAAASASAAEILGFLGRTDEMVACAKALLKKPDAVYAGNVSDDMQALVALAKAKKPPEPPKAPKADRARYDAAVLESSTGKRFKGKPKELARHCFALAVVMNVDDEIIRRWDPKHPYMHFNEAAEVARALVRAKKPARAWEVLATRLSRWYPVDGAQVLPVVLLVDPWLAPLMTPERRQLVLHTPRAEHRGGGR